MATRDRRLLEQILKQWAQEHTAAFVIADYSNTDEGLKNTQGFFTWVIREENINIDLFSLADQIELFIADRKKRQYPDGLICKKCKNFFGFAEPNQSDGSLICYSCRKNPY